MTIFLIIIDLLLSCKLIDVIQEYKYFKKHGKKLNRNINYGEGDYGF